MHNSNVLPMGMAVPDIATFRKSYPLDSYSSDLTLKIGFFTGSTDCLSLALELIRSVELTALNLPRLFVLSRSGTIPKPPNSGTRHSCMTLMVATRRSDRKLYKILTASSDLIQLFSTHRGLVEWNSAMLRYRLSCYHSLTMMRYRVQR